MSELKATVEVTKPADKTVSTPPLGRKPAWETPMLEDVSQQVMAQPYIRFT